TLSIHLPVDCRDRISFVRTPLEDVLRGIDEMPREPTTWRAPTQDFHCSFCGRARADVKSLISGPRVFICDACYAASVAQRREIAQCSFCGIQDERDGLQSQTSEAAICHECLDLVRDILAEEQAR